MPRLDMQRYPFEDVAAVRSNKDITRKSIKHPPKKEVKSELRVSKTEPNKDIFIVHGKDHDALEELKAVIEELGLNPIFLHEQYIGSIIIEKLEASSQNVGFAFVLLTPDDALFKTAAQVFGSDKEKPQYVPHHHPIFRVRQNVLLQFGYFIGRLGRKNVVCLYKKDDLPFDRPSNMEGIVYTPFRSSVNEIKQIIVKILKAAGYEL